MQLFLHNSTWQTYGNIIPSVMISRYTIMVYRRSLIGCRQMQCSRSVAAVPHDLLDCGQQLSATMSMMPCLRRYGMWSGAAGRRRLYNLISYSGRWTNHDIDICDMSQADLWQIWATFWNNLLEPICKYKTIKNVCGSLMFYILLIPYIQYSVHSHQFQSTTTALVANRWTNHI